MFNYMEGSSESSENGMICYYGEEDALGGGGNGNEGNGNGGNGGGGYAKRKLEDEGEESFEKGARKKRYILGQNVGKWTDEEHNRFVLALKKFGRNWTLVQQEVKTRTLVQIRSHAQKYFLKKVRGIAPSTLTMDSKLISTASDGIVPTWLLHDDANYANKTSINVVTPPAASITASIPTSASMARKGSGSIRNMNLFVLDEPSNSETGIVDEQTSLAGICNGIGTRAGAGTGTGTGAGTGTGTQGNGIANNCLTAGIALMRGVCGSGNSNNNTGAGLELDASAIMASRGVTEGCLGETGGLSPQMRFGAYMEGGSLLTDDHREEPLGYDFRGDIMDIKTEVTLKSDYNSSGGGAGVSVSKQLLNERMFDEPCCEKRVSLESNSLASTAVSSPASIGPEKNYVPVSSMNMDILLMPPTIEMNMNQDSVGGGGGGRYPGEVNGEVSTGANMVPGSLNYGFCFGFVDTESIINPSISLSNCDVPWPLTESDHFLQLNEGENAASSSPSTSSSVSYLDVDSSDAKQLPLEVSVSPSKHFDLANSLSDFVYCGDSLGVDMLNLYSNLRGSSSPIINNADVTDFM